MQIGVIGDSNPSEQGKKWAFEVGKEIGRIGAVLVCGGLEGVMREACQGAKSVGGTTVGIIPGNSFKEANLYVDIPVVTGMGWARNIIVVQSSQAVIAIEGGCGTLSEIAYALNHKLPVIGLSTWHLEREGQPPVPIYRAKNAIEAVRIAVEAITK